MLPISLFRWVHSGFKELYREELGYSDLADLSPDEKEKSGRSSSKPRDPRTSPRSRDPRGSPRGARDQRGSSKSQEISRGGSPRPRDPRGSPRPKDPRLNSSMQRKGGNSLSPGGRSRSPRDPRRR